MNDDEFDNSGMLKFIKIGQSMILEVKNEENQVEDIEEVTMNEAVLHDLSALSDRMRSIMETQGGDYALGFEMAMQRAADMIDSLVRRHGGR